MCIVMWKLSEKCLVDFKGWRLIDGGVMGIVIVPETEYRRSFTFHNDN